jgi:hypothetical protein
MKKWSDRKLWQWVIHVAIGFAWSFAGTTIIWMGAGVWVSALVGFWSSLVSASMKEATDQTVFDTLQGMGAEHQGGMLCEHLHWHGWSWKDYAQHAIGGFAAPWVHIAIWAAAT